MCTCSSTCNCSTVCGCAATYDSVCVKYNGADLPNIGAVTGDNLERILQSLDAVLLNIFTLLLDVPIGDNIGGGTELFVPTGANFRTFGDTTDIEWTLNGDLVEARITAAWVTANLAPIIADVLTNTTDIGVLEADMAAVESDIADLRTTTGTLDGDVSMGAYALPGSALVPAAGTTKANIQALANYLADLGVGYTYIANNANLIDALVDLETAIVAASAGEVNDALNVGATGVGIYDGTKTGAQLNLRKIDPIGSYVTAVLNGQKIDLDLNYAALEAQLDTVYVEQVNEKSVVIEPTATGLSIVDGIVGNEERVRGLLASTGVNISLAGKDLVFSVDETWLSTQISAALGMAVQGNAKSYQFSAKSVNSQAISAGATGMRLTIEDDASSGYYDYDNTWTTGRWTANADAATDGDMEFILEGFLENLAITGGGVETVTITLYHDTASTTVSKTSLGSVNVSFPATTAANTKIAFNLTKKISDGGAITLQEGDKVFAEITANGMTVDAQVVEGASIYCLPL